MHKIILNKPSARIAVVTALVISILLGAWFTVWSPLATSAESSNENSVSNSIWARVDWGDGSEPEPYVEVRRENVGGEIKTYLGYVVSQKPSCGFAVQIPNECLKAKGTGNIVLHIDDTSTIPCGEPGSIHVEWNKIPGPWCSVEYRETWHYPDGSIESFSDTETEYPAEAQGTVIDYTLDGSSDEQAIIQKRQFQFKE